MKLPSLAVKGIDRLVLELIGAMPSKGEAPWFELDKFAFGLQALEFDRLELDLLRFLTVSVEKIVVRLSAVARSSPLTR